MIRDLLASIAVLASSVVLRSEDVLVYENPMSAGDSKNNKLASITLNRYSSQFSMRRNQFSLVAIARSLSDGDLAWILFMFNKSNTGIKLLNGSL